ncbi:glycosyltransferase family 39 protein [Candidatus Parcubacteria bacterium]|nr:glycosyltransferase family 39 protein [Candidatus Parcubacteria bacterium]
MNNKQALLILLLILALASFFRLWQLDTIPPGIYPDEAINANQAITEPGKIFYQENHGREGLYINLIAASFSIFGISIWSFKIISALIGILSVLGLYFLTKLLFHQYYENGSRTIALFASFFMAVSFWHINFSRIGFRAILVPFILTFSFYFLFKGFKTQKLWNFILAGAIFGIGFHTYISFRVAVLLLGIVLLLWLFAFRKQNLQKKFFGFAFVFLIFVFIAALPIGIYFLQNPGDFMGRAGGVSIFAQPSPTKALGESLITHLAMFNFFGDYNWRHNVSGSPILFWPIGLLFLIGFILSISKLRGSIEDKKYNLFLVHAFLLSWFFIMLLPGILSYEGIPHSLRCIGALPVVFIFSGIGAQFLFEIIKKIIHKNKRTLTCKIFIVILILLMISFVSVQFNKYFISWGKNPETMNAFSYNCVTIGNYLNSLPQETEKYVIINEPGPHLPLPVQTIMFIQRTKNKGQNTNYIFSDQITNIEISDRPISIVLMDKDENLINNLQIIFPQGATVKQDDVWAYNTK